MPPFSLLFLVLASVPPSQDALPMPPPPPGMRVLGADDKRLLAGSAMEPETPSEDELQEADDADAEEAAELEQLRALEGATLDPGAKPNAEVLQSLRRLGLANPLRMRLLDVLEEPTFREDEAEA